MWSVALKSDKWLYWLALMLFVVVQFALRFFALSTYLVPPSPDYGNYLTQANILRGQDIRGLGLRYNPLFFVILNVFRTFFDDFSALKILASLIFSIVAIPFFILAKRLSNSYLAALVGTWVFLSFEGYAEMIAWGGNPNFLAFSFLLLTVFFLVGSLEDPSRKNLLLAGFCLSLVVGAHFLVAVFTFLFFFVFLVLTLTFNRNDLLKNIKVVLCICAAATALSLPYFPVYVTFAMNSSPNLVRFDLSKQANAAATGLQWMFRYQYLIVLTIAALGVFAMWRQAKKERSNVLVLSSLLIPPFILALTTENPDRWFIFLPIPVVLAFALYLRTLFSAIKDRKREILALGCGFILLVSVGSTTLAMDRLQSAVDYYQAIGGDELQALKWVKDNTDAQVTFATSGPNRIIGGDTMPGNSYSWWIEGYAGRKCLQTGLARWHTYIDERQETETTNRFFAGTYAFEKGDIRASEVFPASLDNPAISACIAGQYQSLVFLNDAEEEITFSPSENDQIVWHQTPFSAERKTMNVYRNETLTNATLTYDWSRLAMTRSIIMSSTQLGVDVVFTVKPRNSTLRQFTLRIWAAYYTSLQGFDVRGSTIILDQKVQTNDVVKTKIEVLSTNTQLNSTKVFYEDPKYSIPLATYTFMPLEISMSVHIRISRVAENPQVSNSEVYFYNSYELIKDLEIDYIFLNKARRMEYNRFLYDPEHYNEVFENDAIIIFKVIHGEK